MLIWLPLPVAVVCVCQAVSQQEREVELVRHVREAVSLGLGVLDADFEKLDVDVANSDSDDDDASAANTKTPVMFERKVGLLVMVTELLPDWLTFTADGHHYCVLHCLQPILCCCFVQDPYLHRPLPFLIGSEEFDRSDDVGIGQLEQGYILVLYRLSNTENWINLCFSWIAFSALALLVW